MMLSASIKIGDGEPTIHRVRDLSPGGMQVDQAMEMEEGTTVVVSVGVLEAVEATVIWVTGDCAGVAFSGAFPLWPRLQ